MNATWEGMLPILGTVIVVEDDCAIRALLQEILDELNAQAISFDTADKALVYLLQTHDRCPLLIVDHGLPGKINGSEFIAMARAKWPKVRSILTSGYLLEAATIPKHTLYLRKPWSPDQLVRAISLLLRLENSPHLPLQGLP